MNNLNELNEALKIEKAILESQYESKFKELN